MADDTKPSNPPFCCESTWSPSSYGWKPSVISSQHFGLPPLMDSRDLGWMENLFRKLGGSSWPGYTRASKTMSMKVHRELSGGVSEVYSEQCTWTVSLDVNHFAPAEITVRTRSGFLEIEGKHEERQDEHGYISRSFIRKYKLPVGIDTETIKSCLSGDGILTVEAHLTSFPLPADVTVPVQVEAPTLEDEQEDDMPRGEIAEGDEISSAESDAAQPTIRPGLQEKTEGEAVEQQDGYDDRLHPTAPRIEGEQELIPSGATEDQQEDKPSEVSPQLEVLLKKEEISEEKTEDAGEVQVAVEEPEAASPDTRQEVVQEIQLQKDEGEDLVQLVEQPEAPQTPDTITSQQEVVQDEHLQKPVGEEDAQLADNERPGIVQTQVEVQPKLLKSK